MKSWREYKSEYKASAAYIQKQMAQTITIIRAYKENMGYYLLDKWRRFWICFWFKGEKPEARFAGWVARLTLILCVIGILQAWSFIESERAFIYPWITMSQEAFNTNKPIVVTLNTLNSGHSGAFFIDTNVTFSFNQLPTEPVYGDGSTNAVYGPIPAGTALRAQVQFHKADGKPLVLSETDIKNINNGIVPFYVFGWIKYTDPFSWFGSKVMGFCGKYALGQFPDVFNNCGHSNYVYVR